MAVLDRFLLYLTNASSVDTYCIFLALRIFIVSVALFASQLHVSAFLNTFIGSYSSYNVLGAYMVIIAANFMHAGQFFLLLFHLLSFFKINFFEKYFQEHFQSVRRFGTRLGLTFWVQTVCQGYQQKTKVVASKERVMENGNILFSKMSSHPF